MRRTATIAASQVIKFQWLQHFTTTRLRLFSHSPRHKVFQVTRNFDWRQMSKSRKCSKIRHGGTPPWNTISFQVARLRTRSLPSPPYPPPPYNKVPRDTFAGTLPFLFGPPNRNVPGLEHNKRRRDVGPHVLFPFIQHSWNRDVNSTTVHFGTPNLFR